MTAKRSTAQKFLDRAISESEDDENAILEEYDAECTDDYEEYSEHDTDSTVNVSSDKETTVICSTSKVAYGKNRCFKWMLREPARNVKTRIQNKCLNDQVLVDN